MAIDTSAAYGQARMTPQRATRSPRQPRTFPGAFTVDTLAEAERASERPLHRASPPCTATSRRCRRAAGSNASASGTEAPCSRGAPPAAPPPPPGLRWMRAGRGRRCPVGGVPRAGRQAGSSSRGTRSRSTACAPRAPLPEGPEAEAGCRTSTYPTACCRPGSGCAAGSLALAPRVDRGRRRRRATCGARCRCSASSPRSCSWRCRARSSRSPTT